MSATQVTGGMTTADVRNSVRTDGLISGIDIHGVHISPDQVKALLVAQRAELLSSLSRDRAETAEGKLQNIEEGESMLGRMVDLQRQAADHGTSTMPADMKKFCQDHNIQWDKTGNDDTHNKDEWSANIQHVQSYNNKLYNDLDLFIGKLKGVVSKSEETMQRTNDLSPENREAVNNVLARA